MVTWNIIQDFLIWLEIHKNSSKYTVRNYTMCLRRFFDYVGEQEIKLYHVDNFRLMLNNKGYSYNWVNVHIASIRSLLKYMLKRDIPVLHYSKIDIGKKEFKIPNYLNRDELQKLFDVRVTSPVLNARNQAILRLLYSTGVRVSELHGMDITSYRHPEMIVVGKGRKPRVVFVSKDAHEAVTRYLSFRSGQSGALFVSHARGNGKRISIVMIEKIVRVYAKKAGITKKITPHAIRHTFATELRKNGVDISYIKEFLGHSSIMTTMIYTHVSNNELKNIHQEFLK